MFQRLLSDFYSPILSFHRSSEEPEKEKRKSNRTRSIRSFQAFSSRGKTQERSFIHSQWSFQPNNVLWPLQCCVCSSPVAQTRSPLPLPATHFEIIHLQRLLFIFQHLSAALGATQTGPSANTGGTATSKGWMWRSEFPSSPDGESAAKLARVTFIEETKAKAGSFPKPLHRDIHLLHFWITGYRTRGKNLPGPIQSSVLLPSTKHFALSFINVCAACINKNGDNFGFHSNNGCSQVCGFCPGLSMPFAFKTPLWYTHCRPHFKEAGVILLLVSIQVLWHTELNLHQPITNRF